MALDPYHKKQDYDDSPGLDMAIAAVLWIGAVSLVVAVNYGAENGVSENMQGLLMVMHQFYGKWVVAGVAALAGLGMCVSALRRMNAAPKRQDFLPGMMILESFRWMRQPTSKTRRDR